MLSKFDIQKLQDLPIEQVAEALGLEVHRHKCLCPFHNDSHPSLTFHTGRNRYRCYVCDARGGTIDLVMHLLHKDFLEACKWLADENNLVVSSDTNLEPRTLRSALQLGSSKNLEPKTFDASRYQKYFDRPFLIPEARKFLFEERHLDPRVVRWCRLTSWRDKQGIPWLQTPYYDRSSKLIGIQNRNLAYSSKTLNLEPSSSAALNLEPAAPRFKFPRGSKCSIYNLQILNLLKPGETLYITEGCSDCWAMLSSGHKAIAIPSATLLTRKDKELLQSLNSQPIYGELVEPTLNFHFAMFPDQDLPGERLFLQLQQVLPNLVRHQLPRDCKDFSDYYLKTLIPH